MVVKLPRPRNGTTPTSFGWRLKTSGRSEGYPLSPEPPPGGGYPSVFRPFFTGSVSVGVNVSGTRSPSEPPLVVVKPLNPQGVGTPPTSNLLVVKSWEAKGGTGVVPIGGTLLVVL